MRSRIALFVGLALMGLPPIAPAQDQQGPRPPTRIVEVDGPDRLARQPQVAVDRLGRIFVAFGVGDSIRCARSVDGGKSFEVATVGTPGLLSLGMRRGPRIALAGEAVVVSAIGGVQGKGKDGDLLAWRSPDLGKTWVGPTRINTVEGSAREGLHGMAASEDGSVFCSWLDLRARKTEIFGARSKDGGLTWEPDRLVYQSPSGSVCQCCHPSVAYEPDGGLLVMWRNQIQGDRDLYLSHSSDGGSTFEPARKLGLGSWPLNACPMDGGMVASGPGGQVESAWMRKGEVFASRPGEAERRLGRGVQPWTAIGPGGPHSVWLAGRPGKLMAKIPGRAEPLTLADDAIDPVVAAAPGARGPVVVAWEAKAGGLFAIILDRLPR